MHFAKGRSRRVSVEQIPNSEVISVVKYADRFFE